MSNIHGFHNIAPARAPPVRQAGYSRQMQPQEVINSPEAGISMMAPPPRPDGKMHELCERIFPRMALRTATTALCIIECTMFIIELIVGGARFGGAFVKGNDMGGPGGDTLLYLGAKYTPDIQDGAIHRFITPIFLHAGVIHLASNMFFQMRFGYVCEARWGIKRFLATYFLAGIMASFWSAQLSPHNISVGASGALFGVAGADITYLAYNWVEIPHRQMEAFFLGFVTLINFLFGIGQQNGIDNYAHLGGLIGGLFLGIFMPPHLVIRPYEKLFRGGALVGFLGLSLLFLLLIFVGRPA